MASRSRRRALDPTKKQRAAAQENIEERRRLYEQHRDPLRVWEAYALARAWGLEIPDWVLAYLDRASRQLVEISQFPPKRAKSGSRVLAALEVARPGRGSVISRRRAADRDEELAGAVHRLLCEKIEPHQRAKLSVAIDDIAARYGIGRNIVERAYRAARKRWKHRSDDSLRRMGRLSQDLDLKMLSVIRPAAVVELERAIARTDRAREARRSKP